MTPAGVDDYSSNATQMQTQSDPGEQGSESLSTSLADELARIRYVLAEMKGQSYWYETAFGSLADPAANQILHNTSFEIWQRGVSLTDAASANVITDGWSYHRLAGGAGRVTLAQETAVLPTVAQVGAYVRACASVTVTTNDAAIAAGDFYFFQHRVEGYYFQPIAQRTFTLSFWVRSAVTGTYCVSFRNGGIDRAYVAEYTISSANTWEYKTVTVTASPSAGTWNYTNGTGLYIAWCLAAGTDFHTSAGAWTTGNYLATSNQANFMATGANTFYLAAPKITPGPSATRWLPLPHSEEMGRAQRYYEKSYNPTSPPGSGVALGQTEQLYLTAAIPMGHTFRFRAVKRTDPNVTVYDSGGSANVINVFDGGAWASGKGVTFIFAGADKFSLQADSTVSGNAVAYAFVAQADVT